MGREIAEAVPEAMDVYRRASEASGLDLMRLCFEAPEHELVQTEVQQPALVATSLAVLAALRARGYRAGLRRRPFGRRVRGAGRVTGARDRGRDRARPRARAGDGRGRARAPGLDGGDPRPRGRGRREALPPDRGVWPANYNCPGQIVVSGENPAVDACCDEAAAPRRAPHGQAPRVGRVPQPARRPGRRASCGRRSSARSSPSRSRRSCRR